jgi:hypothetical protein
MTSLPAERLAAEASQVSFRRVVLTAILALGFAIGWVPGVLWRGTVFFALAIREGWREGTGARVAARPQPAEGGG